MEKRVVKKASEKGVVGKCCREVLQKSAGEQ